LKLPMILLWKGTSAPVPWKSRRGNCWVRLGSSTWNILWLWNTKKGRLQKQVQKTTWKFSANVIEQHRQRRSIRISMLKVASLSGLNFRRMKLEQS